MTREATEASVQACYASWAADYHQDYYGPDAPYPPVHRDLIRGLLRDSGARSVLDAGCGPASFLREIAGDGLELHGFDLTPEMIDEAQRVMSSLGHDPRNFWVGSVLDRDAFRGRGRDTGAYDAVVCVGVLPHVRAEDEPALLANLFEATAPGGLAVIEARNQLFALFTLNRYTRAFFEDELIRADVLAGLAGPEAGKLRGAVAALADRFRTDLPPARRGRSAGYDEVLSRTHNPLVLPGALAAAGFRGVRTLFYHYHCLPPMLEAQVPALFRQQSLAMEDPQDWRGHFMASAFLVVGERP